MHRAFQGLCLSCVILIASTISDAQQKPAGVSVTPANYNQIAILKWYKANQVTSFAVPNPKGVAYDGANIWVANNNGVTEIQANSGAIIGSFPVGSGPQGVAFDGSNIWVANNDGTITKLQAKDGSNVGTFSVGGAPFGIAFDGTDIWVSNYTGNTVIELANDGTILNTIHVGVNPEGVAFDGESIWVANYGSNTVTRVRVSTGKKTGTFPVGMGPQGIAFDGANVWVTKRRQWNCNQATGDKWRESRDFHRWS